MPKADATELAPKKSASTLRHGVVLLPEGSSLPAGASLEHPLRCPLRVV